MKTFSHLWKYLAKFLSEWGVFLTKVIEKIKTHILCSVTLFSKIAQFMRKCRKICWRLKGHKWRHNMAHVGDWRATNDVTIWRMLETEGTQMTSHYGACWRLKGHKWRHNMAHVGDWRAINDVTIWRMRVACWISKATCTHAHEHAQTPYHSHARTHPNK
jgi:hypothetical protein